MAKWSSLIELRDQRPLTLVISVLCCKVMSSECAWRMRPGLESHLPVSVSSNFIPDVPFLYYYLLSAETTCPDLPNPVNGIVDIQGNTPGGSAVYLCNPGLSLIGSSRRICNVDGTWSGEPPTCIGRLREYTYDGTHLLSIINHIIFLQNFYAQYWIHQRMVRYLSTVRQLIQ